jgi:hypothetical protein
VGGGRRISRKEGKISRMSTKEGRLEGRKEGRKEEGRKGGREGRKEGREGRDLQGFQLGGLFFLNVYIYIYVCICMVYIYICVCEYVCIYITDVMHTYI